MAGFAYTNSTNFRPFSYQDMLAPMLAYTEAHQKLEEDYSKLNTDANTIGAMANETNDPKTYARYKAYEASLREQADALAQNGLTPGSRKSLLDLKGRYASEITPIQDAITRKRKWGDAQLEAWLKDPTLMFQRDLTTINPESSLDRFLENSEYNYGDVYSGAMITKQVSDMASHLANQLRGTSSGRLDDYTKTFMQNYGLSVDEVLAAINNPNSPEASKALSAIYDTALASVPQSIREKYADDIKGYASQGFWSAIGQNKISTYEDYAAKMKLKNYYDNKNKTKEELTDYPLTPNPILSRKKQNEIDKNKKRYERYFTTDKEGNMVLTDEGRKRMSIPSNNIFLEKGIRNEYTGKLSQRGIHILVNAINPNTAMLDTPGGNQNFAVDESGRIFVTKAGLREWEKYLPSSVIDEWADDNGYLTEQGLNDIATIVKAVDGSLIGGSRTRRAAVQLEKGALDDPKVMEVFRKLNPDTSSTSDFRSLLSNLVEEGSDVDSLSNQELGALWSNYTQGANSGTLSYRSKYDFPINSDTDRKNFKKLVINAAQAEGALYSVDMDDETNTYIDTNDNLPLSELVTNKYEIINRSRSYYGSTIDVLNTETGEVKQYRQPPGINLPAETDSQSALDNMHAIEVALANGEIDGHKLNEQQIAALKKEFNKYRTVFASIDSNIGATYSTAKIDRNAYGW